ncbi:extracelular serine carboxypeptidase-like protein [Xylariales sp. PMI_506]|nr:extracelular serine carboxypeptidase-like protein [Xylariales sp. PMI_506]
MKISTVATGLLATLLGTASARRLTKSPAVPHHVPRQDVTNGRPLSYPVNYFTQKVDHFPDSDRYLPHTNDTFQQRYYFDHTYYQEGGPVFLYISGETSGPSRWSNMQTGIIQILMQAFNGLGVVIENRYYGQSYPYNTSTTDQLAYLTNEQTVADFANFAQHATFPGVEGDLTAPGTPWIVYGGSLAGAETAFTIKLHGDILYAGIASSAPVFLPVGYPDWYDPIQKYAPQDCVSRINNIVENFDNLVSSGNRGAVDQFKALFGLESLTDDRDFAQAIADPIGNPGSYPTATWQELNWFPAYGFNDFFEFCGNVSAVSPAPAVAAIDYALANYTNGEPWIGLGGYATYVRDYMLPQACPGGDYNSNACFGTQNASWWANVANSADRSYLYTSCTEQGAYIDAPAPGGPTLLSRVIDTSYEQQWCAWAFPPGEYNHVPSSPDVDGLNSFGGYDFEADRLAFIDGDQDVWKDLTYHSDFAGPRATSTDLHPQYLITGAGHHWDSYGILDIEAEPQFIREAHKWEIRTVQKWLDDFGSWQNDKRK